MLRIISIPVAIRYLGMEQFGVYATILVIVQMMDVFHVGIGPALTQKLSKANLENDTEKEARLFSTSMIISASITFVIALGLWITVWNVPITELFGDKYAPFAESMRRACLIGIVIIAIELVCLVAERARDGYMETRYTNSWGAFGNFLAAAMLLIGVMKYPTIEFLVLAINGSVVLAKFGNMVQMMIQRPYLLPRLKTYTPKMVKMLMSGALIFTVVYGSSGITEYNVIGYMIGRFLGPEQAANYSVLVSIHVMMVGVISMLTIPMWPAVIDAYERRDFEWVSKAARKLRLVAVGFGGAAFVGMALLGAWVVKLWIGDDFSLGRGTMTIFGCYFALHLWRHVNQILCLGLSREKTVAKVVGGEVALSFFASLILLKAGFTIPWVLGAICISMVCFSGWLYPLIYGKTFRSGVSKHHMKSEPKTPTAKGAKFLQV